MRGRIRAAAAGLKFILQKDKNVQRKLQSLQTDEKKDEEEKC